MRRVIYICDSCKREYEYLLQPGTRWPDILKFVFDRDLCRKCLKELITIKDQKNAPGGV